MPKEEVKEEQPYAACLLALDQDVAKPIFFKNGVAAGPREDGIRNAMMQMAGVLRPDQKWKIQKKSFWLSAPIGEPGQAQSVQQQIQDTAVGLQVASPVGCEYFIVLTHVSSAAGDSVLDRGSLMSSEWTRRTAPKLTNETDCKLIVDAVLDAFSNKSRMMNPLRLFELGLQSHHSYIRTMLWTTALDGLLMAKTSQLFVARLCKYLGETHDVFPPSVGIAIMPLGLRQAAYDLFELRSTVAHGEKIPEKFWKPLQPVTPANTEVAYQGTSTLAACLEEASLLLLTAVLRKIIREDLSIIDNEKKWRSRLNL